MNWDFNAKKKKTESLSICFSAKWEWKSENINVIELSRFWGWILPPVNSTSKPF